MKTDNVIKAVGLTKIFRTESVQTTALNEVNLEIYPGEFVAIMGPSGCGKSTLLNIMGLLDNPTSGELWFMGQEVSRWKENDRTDLRNGNLGFVFQSFNLIDELTVFENVELPLLYAGVPVRERVERVNRALDRMQITHRSEHYPQQLSGGQQQRAALGKLLLAKPKILLLDEPTKGMDAAARQSLGQQLRALTGQGVTIVLATHDLDFAALYTELCGMLFDGQLSPLTPSRQFFRQHRIYTTPAHRMAASCLPEAVTCGDVLAALEVQA